MTTEAEVDSTDYIVVNLLVVNFAWGSHFLFEQGSSYRMYTLSAIDEDNSDVPTFYQIESIQRTNRIAYVDSFSFKMIDVDSGFGELSQYEVNTQSFNIFNLAAYSPVDSSSESWYVLQYEDQVGFRVLQIDDVITSTYSLSVKLDVSGVDS